MNEVNINENLQEINKGLKVPGHYQNKQQVSGHSDKDQLDVLKSDGEDKAENPKAIKQLLRRDGIFLTELKESGPRAKKKAGGGSSFQVKLFSEKVSTEDLAVSTRQLSTLVGAGISLVESLTALIDQVENQTLKGV